MSLRVAILEAHARCVAVVARSPGAPASELIWEALLPLVGRLQGLWADLLQVRCRDACLARADCAAGTCLLSMQKQLGREGAVAITPAVL